MKLHEDVVTREMAALFESARPLAELPGHQRARLKSRIRQSLEGSAGVRAYPFRLRPVIVLALLLGGSTVVGAAIKLPQILRSVWRQPPGSKVLTAPESGRTPGRPGPKRSLPAEATPAGPVPQVSTVPEQSEEVRKVAVAVVPPARRRARPVDPAPVAVAPARAVVPREEDLLAKAVRALRGEHDAAAALRAVDACAADFPLGDLTRERSALRVEALLALGRDREALSELDALAIEGLPLAGERHLLRAELRAEFERWSEAAHDFDGAVASLSRSDKGDPAAHDLLERALWGRAVARARSGDLGGARADLDRYLQTFRGGRFAADARRLRDAQP